MPTAPQPPPADAPAAIRLGFALRQRRQAMPGIRNREQLAERLGYSVAVIKDVENGVYRAGLHRYLTRWENVFGLDPELEPLWQEVRQDHNSRPQTAGTVRLRSPDEDSAPARDADAGRWATTIKALDVRRDHFLKLAGLGVASVVAPPLVHGWSDPSVVVPELTEELLAQLRAQTEGWRWLDRREGANTHLPVTAASARNLTVYWRQVDSAHPLRKALAEVAADACHLVAYQCFDQGQRTQATEWYRCAADLAAHAASQDLYAFALCGVAYMHARNGHGDLALSVLDQLSTLPFSAAARCHVAAYTAHSHASGGQLVAALRQLDTADAWAQRVADEAVSVWLGIPDRAFVARQRAIILASSGSPEALPILQELRNTTPGVFRRYRVTVAVDQARVHAYAAHADQAAATLSQALMLNQQTRSVEKARQGLAVRRLLHQERYPAPELDEVIHATQAREIAAATALTSRVPGPAAGA